MTEITELQEAAYEAARAEFFMVCRQDPRAEKQWPKAAAATGAALVVYETKIAELSAELAEAKEWIVIMGRSQEQEMTADRASA